MKNFNRLIEIARALKPGNHPTRTFHTTFILKGSKVLSIGMNSAKTHPRTLKYNYHCQPNTHSELSALLKLGREDCSDLTFVNVRLTKDNEIGISKPCRGCMDMLNQVGFKSIIYTVQGDRFEQLD